MVELTWYQNMNSESPAYKKWYVRPVIKQMFGIHEMSKHMAEHNTPFSAGTIEGILTDFSKCIREQLLNGNSVKIDNLGIFKLSVSSNGYTNIGGIDSKTGMMFGMAKVGHAVRYTKMLATSTGDMMREYLNRDVQFGWDTESQQKIDAAKEEIRNNLEKLEELGEQVMKEQQEAEGKQPEDNANGSGENGKTDGGGNPTADADGVKPNQDEPKTDVNAGNSSDAGAQTSEGAQENDGK